MEPAELNQELFDKTFGKDSVKSEKEFRAKIKEEVEKSFVSESDNKLKNDVILHLIKKTKLSLPDTFLKKWLVATNEQGLTEDQVEAEYERYSKSLKWQLIENKIIKENDIKVENEEVMNYTKGLLISQYAQYGMPAPEEAELEETAKKVLTNQDEAKKVYEMLYDEKILAKTPL